MSDQKPIFVLGLGAQKSGTTWLYSYLQGEPLVRMVWPKELHIWDSLTLPECERFRHYGEPIWYRRMTSTLLRRKHPWQMRRKFLQDPESYFDYFAEILSQPGISATGDITPTYMNCNANTLRMIRDGFANRGIEVRSVLLLRDPVRRCWSQLKMLLDQGREEELFGRVSDPQAEFARFCAAPVAQTRTDYPHAIKTMREVFGEKLGYIGFFETMFSKSEIKRLSEFLGVASHPQSGEVRVHGGSSLKLTYEARAEARKALADIYDHTAELLPAAREVWDY